MMTAHMVELQHQLKGTGVRFLSLSVDPSFDTPEVLKKYGQARGADFSTWTFATGDQDLIFSVAKALMQGVTPASGDVPIMHSTWFVLVDANGKMHSYYSGTDAASLKALQADARALDASGEPR
jgi:protein SCO1/2